MKLDIFKALTHISPSTFNNWRDCQYKIYLNKLAGLPYIKGKQGLAAAIGTSFDAHIKNYLSMLLSIDRDDLNLNYMLNKGIDAEHRQEAIRMGEILFHLYIDSGFVDFEPHILQLVLQLDLERYRIREGIPILGILDMTLNGIPFDWKTRGMTSKTGAYPTPGWCERWKIPKGDIRKIKKEHNSCHTLEEGIEKTNKTWAIQMVFYNWLMGNEEHKYIIHELTKRGDDYWLAKHEGTISQEFVQQIFRLLKKFWTAISGDDYKARIEEPNPHQNICEKYGVVCQVADQCKFYENTLGNPLRRSNYVRS